MADYVPLVVCRFWLIPNGMNNMASGLFSTELYCLRQILPPCIIRIALILSICVHLRYPRALFVRRIPLGMLRKLKNVLARHYLPSSRNPVRNVTERNDVGRGIIYRHHGIPAWMLRKETMQERGIIYRLRGIPSGMLRKETMQERGIIYRHHGIPSGMLRKETMQGRGIIYRLRGIPSGIEAR